NFPSTYHERDVLHSNGATIVQDLHVLHVQHHLFGCAWFFRHHVGHLTSHHQRSQLGFRGLCRCCGAYHTPATQHSDAMGYLEDFAELMRNKDNGGPLGGQGNKRAKEVLCFGRGQYCCGFVQNQDGGLAVEGFEDLDTLANAYWWFLDSRQRINLPVILLSQGPKALGRTPEVEKRTVLGVFTAQNNVLRHGH